MTSQAAPTIETGQVSYWVVAAMAAVLSVGLVSTSANGTRPMVADLSELQTGEEIYSAACAGCHGSDGTGVSPSRLGFDTPPPDLSDCSFGPREANFDWIAIAHEGGPVRAFSRFMPAFGEALSVGQITSAVNHIRSFCTDRSWPRGEFNLPRALFTTKAFPEDEVVLAATIAAQGRGRVEIEGIVEKRIGPRGQIEFVLPLGWTEASSADNTGNDEWRSAVGDLVVAYKHVLSDDLDSGTMISANAEVIVPTGSEDAGLSSGTVIFEPQLLWAQLLPENFFLQGQVGAGLPLDTDNAQEEGFARLALGRTFNENRWGRAWSPMVELLSSYEFADGEKVQFDLAPQMQVTLSGRQHVRMNVGARIPLTDADERPTTVGVYFLWDFFDGAFLEGW